MAFAGAVAPIACGFPGRQTGSTVVLQRQLRPTAASDRGVRQLLVDHWVANPATHVASRKTPQLTKQGRAPRAVHRSHRGQAPGMSNMSRRQWSRAGERGRAAPLKGRPKLRGAGAGLLRPARHRQRPRTTAGVASQPTVASSDQRRG